MNGVLAEKAKINRTAAYSHINSLLEKGIIAKVKGSTNKIVANPPDDLHFLVEQKAIQVGMLQEKLPSVISLLNSAVPHANNTSPSEMKYYKGRSGVKVIYEEALKSNEIRSYFNPMEADEIFPENFNLFYNAFILNPKIKIYEICEDTPVTKYDIERNKDHIRHLWKILPKDIKLTANDILIYNGKVAIINVGDKNDISGVVLHNKDYYNNSVQLFDLLWRLLPEPEIK